MAGAGSSLTCAGQSMETANKTLCNESTANESTEAIMSSPIHHADDVDAALVYAPPWARSESRGDAPLEDVWETRRSRGASRRSDPAPRPFSGDRAMRDLQRRFSLDPEGVPEPPPRPLKDESALKTMTLRLGGFAAAAALIAWGAVAVPGVKLFESQPAEAGFPALQVALERIAQDPSRVTALAPLAAREEPAPAKLVPSQPSPPASGEVKPAEPAAAPSPPAAQTADVPVEIDKQEMAVLVKRGQDALTSGDFASARLLLRRAAAAGSAMAALSLGASYDPQVIKRLGAVGAEPDTELARKWYRKAQALGSDTAGEQLAKLEQSR
jgi:hypothetical protein